MIQTLILTCPESKTVKYWEHPCAFSKFICIPENDICDTAAITILIINNSYSYICLGQQVPVQLRAHAADSMFYEAHTRIQDPIYGCVGIISRLQHEIYSNQRELARTQAEIAFYTAQQAQDTRIQQLHHVDDAPVFNGPFRMDQHLLDPHYQAPGFL